MPKYNVGYDLLQDIKALADRIGQLERSNQLDNSSVTLANGTESTVTLLASNAAGSMTSDGIVPDVARPTAIGGKATVILHWPNVTLNVQGGTQSELVKYNVHVSATPTFVADDSNKVAETYSTYVVLQSLADGSFFEYEDYKGDPQLYYFQVITEDRDGQGPVSEKISAIMGRDSTQDLEPRSVTASLLEPLLRLASTVTTQSVDPAKASEFFGPGITMNEEGLAAYDASGLATLEVRPNQVPSTSYRGNAEIRYLMSLVNAFLQDVTLGQGSTFKLKSSVATPTVPATAQFTYDSVQALDPIPSRWHNRTAWTLSNGVLFCLRNVPDKKEVYVERWGLDGTYVTNVRTDLRMTATGGAMVGGVYWCVLNDGQRLVLAQVDPITGASTWKDISDVGGLTAGRYVAVGDDAGTLMLAQSRSANSDQVRVVRLNAMTSFPVDPVTVASTFDTTFPYKSHLSHILYGSFDFGTPRYVFAGFGNSNYQVVDTTGVLDATRQWPAGISNGTGIQGLVWDGTNFIAISDTGVLQKYGSGNLWTASADATWYVSYSWTSSTAETLVCTAITSFTMQKRARLLVTTAALPSGVTGAKVYLAKGATPPSSGTASMTSQGAVTSTSPMPRREITNAVFTPNNNLTVSTFGAGTVSKIEADGTTPGWRINSDGSGNIGTEMAWNASGAFPNTGWVTPTPTSPFTNSTTIRYRRDLAGNIHMRGAVTVNGAADGSTIFTLPSGLRPAFSVRQVVDTNPVTTSSGRIVVGTDGTVKAFIKSGAPTLYWIDMVFSLL